MFITNFSNQAEQLSFVNNPQIPSSTRYKKFKYQSQFSLYFIRFDKV